MRTPGRGAAGLLALSTALLLLSGSPEAAYVTLAAAGGLLLVELDLTSGTNRLAKSVGWTMLAVALGAGISAVQTMPFVAAASETIGFDLRGASSIKEQASAATPGSEDLLESVLPFVHGVESDHLPEAPRRVRGTWWSGGLVLVFAWFGVAVCRGREHIYLTALAIGSAALAVRFVPLMTAFRLLPYGEMVLSRYFWLPAGLALVSLCGLGLEAAFTRGLRLRLAAVLVLASALGGIAVLSLWQRIGETMSDPAAAVPQVAALFVGLVAAGVFLATRVGEKRVLLALTVLLLLERQVEMGSLYRSFPRTWFYPDVPIASTLRSASPDARVAGLKNLLYPNLSTAWSLESVTGYNPMILRRLSETFPFWTWDKGTDHQFVRVAAPSPMLSYLNVRFLVTRADVSLPGWIERSRFGRLAILENSDALPRIFSPRTVRVGGDDGADLASLAELSSFRDVAWIEAEDDSGPRERANGPCRLELLDSGFRYRLLSDCEQPSWLVTSIPAWPGWRIRVDDAVARASVANHAFVAFRVDEGRHRVELDYRPVAVIAGATVSASTILAVFLVAFSTSRRRLHPEVSGPSNVLDAATSSP